MDFQALRYFISVTQLGSFTAAANQWETDPTTLSRAVTALEQYLNARLLNRSTRAVTLTAEGNDFLSTATSILAQLDGAIEHASATNTEPSGLLRITTSQAFGQVRLVPLLPKFHALYPKVEVDLVISDSTLDMTAERIDLGVRMAASVNGDFIATKLITAKYHVVASPTYLASAPSLNSPKDLTQHSCVVVDLAPFRTAWNFKSANGERSNVPIKSWAKVSSPVAQFECARLGLGPALLPNWLIANDLKAGRLIDLLPNYTASPGTEAISAWLIYPSKRFLPRRVRVAIDFLKEHITE